MLRNMARMAPLAQRSVSSVRFFSATAAHKTKTPSELYTAMLRDHPDTLRAHAVKSFPIQEVIADAAKRHALRSRCQTSLDSASLTPHELGKLADEFKAEHVKSTTDYVDAVVSRFILVLQENLAKNTQQTFYDVYESSVKDFLNAYEATSSINDLHLAPRLSPENIIRLCFQTAAEEIFDQLKNTDKVKNESKEVHNHYNLSVKCSANR